MAGSTLGRRCPPWLRACALALALLGAVAAQARAVVVGFDEVSAGTPLTEQYASLGVHFGPSPFASISGAFTAEARPGQARSAPNVARLAHDPGTGQSSSWMRFDRQQAQVRFHACRSGDPGIPPNVNVRALDANLNEVANLQGIECTLGGALVPVTVTARNITWVNVYGQDDGWAIDDLEFETDPAPQPPPPLPPPPPPVPVREDFGLFFDSPIAILGESTATIGVAPGGTVTRQLVVRRNATSTGPIRLSIDGLLTSGVRGTIAPEVVSGPGEQVVTMTLTGEPDAQPRAFTNQVVRATPLNPFAGSAPREVTFTLIVQGQLSVRTQGIEISQAVQTYDQPTRDPYDGVPLVRDKKTVVRVFADYAGVEPARVPGYPARPPMTYALNGVDATGRALPGSPILPVWSPPLDGLSVNDSGLSFDERHSPRSAFVFVLPPSWTRGRIALTAQALAPQPPRSVLRATLRPDPPAATVCLSFRCGASPLRGLGGITFRDPPPAKVISALELLYIDKGALTGVPVAAGKALSALVAMSPVPFLFLDPAGNPTPVPTYRATRFAPQGAILEAAQAYDDATERLGDYVLGLFAWPPGAGYAPGPRVGVADASALAGSGGAPQRPATTVAHELFHLLGQGHADSACGGGGGGFPDPTGRLSSVGMDTRDGSGGTAPGDPPFRIIQDTLFFRGYDLMSYCGGLGGGDPRHWISARTWSRLLGEAPREGTERTPRVRSSHAGGPPRLLVFARSDLTGVRIVDVRPGATGEAAAGPPDAPVLVARDAAGRQLAAVPMAVAAADGAQGASPFRSLSGSVPAAGVARVEVVEGGAVVASRSRTPRAPAVRLLAPAAGARLDGSRTVGVRWRAADGDGDALQVFLDYSADGGRTWREVAGGADRGGVALAPGTLAASARGRLRVRADDGFTVTTAPPLPVVVTPRAPLVAVQEPVAGQRPQAGATLTLRGTAADDRGRPVPDARLRWFAGRRALGRGGTIAALLPAGAASVRLEATDAAGRRGSATVRLRPVAVAPGFLRLDAPERLPRTARSLTLTVAATQPAALLVAGRRVQVDRAPRAVRVAVRPGTAPLELRLVLAAGGFRTGQVLVVERA